MGRIKWPFAGFSSPPPPLFHITFLVGVLCRSLIWPHSFPPLLASSGQLSRLSLLVPRTDFGWPKVKGSDTRQLAYPVAYQHSLASADSRFRSLEIAAPTPVIHTLPGLPVGVQLQLSKDRLGSE